MGLWILFTCIVSNRLPRYTATHIATRCDTMQHTATHYDTLQHAVTHCNPLQYPTTGLGCEWAMALWYEWIMAHISLGKHQPLAPSNPCVSDIHLPANCHHAQPKRNKGKHGKCRDWKTGLERETYLKGHGGCTEASYATQYCSHMLSHILSAAVTMYTEFLPGKFILLLKAKSCGHLKSHLFRAHLQAGTTSAWNMASHGTGSPKFSQ